MTDWFYNESKQTGINFNNQEEVLAYDEKFKKSRNLDFEFAYISKEIALDKESTVLELGTGTGELAIRMAKHCGKVIARDISGNMLSLAEKKAKDQGITNIEFELGGYLDLNRESLDAVVSQLSLHHLPDLWKAVAIKKVSASLKPGGIFFLGDTVLSLEMDKFEDTIDMLIGVAMEKAGEKIAREMVVNLSEEYPTFDWVIKNMLEKSGFTIQKIDQHSPLFASIICQKKG